MTQNETLTGQQRRDPIVEEIREIRQQHARTFNFEPDAIFADLKRHQDEGGYEVVAFPARRTENHRKGIT